MYFVVYSLSVTIKKIKNMNNIELNTALLNIGYRYMGMQKDKFNIWGKPIGYIKLFKSYIEKFKIKNKKYNYFPKTKEELKDIIKQRIKKDGPKVDLNDIDVSKITDMSGLFKGIRFNGDISKWDVSNVTNMKWMFWGCSKFNQDISNWNVSNVTDMRCMFLGCETFNQNISNWNVSNVKDMSLMFAHCKKFNQDISNWNVSNVTDMSCMFYGCESFNQDISSWDVSKE